MKRFAFSLLCLLCLATIAEANHVAGVAAVRVRERVVRQRVVVRQNVVAVHAAPLVVRQRVVASYGYAAPLVSSYSYGAAFAAPYVAPVIAPVVAPYAVAPYALGVDAGCGCYGGAAGFSFGGTLGFRSRAFLGLGFGY